MSCSIPADRAAGDIDMQSIVEARAERAEIAARRETITTAIWSGLDNEDMET